MTRIANSIAIAVAWLLLTTHLSAAEPTGSATARKALALCDRADEAAATEKPELLKRGLELGERAAAADTQDAAAHFAIFCNLGKRTALDRMPLSSLLALRRLRRELDLTLALAPNDPDALAAKGALLLNLPRLLGGDRAEAERLLRRALEVEPGNTQALRYLDRVLAERGAKSEAPLAVSH